MDAAVIASISTPVGPVVAASARIRSTPAARSGVMETTRSVSGIGWQSGMSSAVRLPPITPASSATVRTSPFEPPPSITRLSVSADTATSASATARRAVAGLALTSTIRGRPRRSTWVRRRRSDLGASVRSMDPPARRDRTRPAWTRVGSAAGPSRTSSAAPSAAVEPAELHLHPGLRPLERLRDDGEGVRGGEGGQDMAPLAAGEPHAHAARVVAGRGPVRVTNGRHALEPASPDALRHRLLEDGPVDRAVEPRLAGETAQDGAHEELEGDERGDRVAREAEEEHGAGAAIDVGPPEGEGLARLDRHAPQVH